MSDKPEAVENAKQAEKPEQPERDGSKFDWVTKRSQCSLPRVFKTLILEVQEDVDTRNALRPNNAPYSFSMLENGADLTVSLSGEGVRVSVVFSLAPHAILVRDDLGKALFEVTLSFSDEGECKLRVNEKEYELWQVRRMALEDLLFRSN